MNRLLLIITALIPLLSANAQHKKAEAVRFQADLITATVYNTENDTICNVLMSGGRSKSISTTCEKTPILEWAFEEMPTEFAKCQYVTNNEYTPFYFQISFNNGDSETIVLSSYKQIVNNKAFATKVDELKKFLIDLWCEYFIDEKDRGKK